MKQIDEVSKTFYIRNVDSSERKLINEIVDLHRLSFEGFFLSTMNKGFLRHLYMAFCEHEHSELIVAFENEIPVGFMACSWDTSGVYRFMLRRHLIPFAWYAFLAVLRRPSLISKMFRATSMPKESVRDENYVKIFSLGVHPDYHGRGFVSMLLEELKHKTNFARFKYITLETDAENNDAANKFYQQNGMKLSSTFVTPEGRKMNKYHYRIHRNEDQNDDQDIEQNENQSEKQNEDFIS